ncbi:hypothetical protein [Caudoviricetes sp.]|nr:hypothetical protein [Caudoviricetes sp.]
MSTIKATTLSNLAGSATVPTDTVVSGTAKAWVNFNGTGTVAIRRAFNVSSITDNGTGDYTVNFTSAMVDANYAVVGETGGTATVASLVLADQTTARTTTAFRLYVITTGGALIDAAQVNTAIFY